ncbi:O-antigen ligase family protein, partial [Neobacillus vireti]|uniref:O-antigen ligase family protein n=1 Tax=Neobacillus vireti TaxID=220686 RepID=UPI002FFEB34F
NTIEYFFQFLFNCVFISYVANYKYNSIIVIKILIWLGIAFSYVVLPSILNTDYVAMRISYGLLPSCLGLIYLAFNKKYSNKVELLLYFLLLLTAFKFLIFSGSRGAVFSIFVYLYVLIINKLKTRATKITFSFIVIILIYYFVFYLDKIILQVNNFLLIYNIDIEWLDRSIRQMDSDAGLLSNRDQLYEGAVKLISEHPIFGIGIGNFDSIYGIYPHNLVLELMVEFGLVGTIIFIFIIIMGYIKSLKSNKNIKVMMQFLFSLSIPQLMFSNSFWLSSTFWMYILISIYLIRKNFNYVKCG